MVDPSMNPSLELALQKAKYYNLPRDVVDKAIKKWSGQLRAEDLKEVFMNDMDLVELLFW